MDQSNGYLGEDDEMKKKIFELFFAYISKTTENFWILTGPILLQIWCSTTFISIIFFEISTKIWKKLILVFFWQKKRCFFGFFHIKFNFFLNMIFAYWRTKISAKNDIIGRSLRWILYFIWIFKYPKKCKLWFFQFFQVKI